MSTVKTLSMFLSAVTVTTLLCPAALAKGKYVTESLKINATPEAVFHVLQSYRNSTSMHRKLVSYDGTSAVVEEQFEGVPVLGKVHCTWVEKEVPYQRIDYSMVKSDKFVSGSGSYVISPSGTSSCVLELNSQIDSGVKIPFAKEIGAVAEHKDMKVRLARIKMMAETAEIAQK